MRYDFEVDRIASLPIQDWSELEEWLKNAEIQGWILVSTFESHDSFEDDHGRRHQGQYLFGIFRRAQGWPEMK